MFALLKDKNPYEASAPHLYAAALERVRTPVLYTLYGVPDTLDGRFDLLSLHIFMIMNRVMEEQGAAELNQALFDAVFADMDQMLREMGIGDMGVPKRMRRMMKAFNGRMNAYQSALADDQALEDALIRNLYGTLDAVEAEHVERIKTYVQKQIEFIKDQPISDIMKGVIRFEGIEDVEEKE